MDCARSQQQVGVVERESAAEALVDPPGREGVALDGPRSVHVRIGHEAHSFEYAAAWSTAGS